MKIYWHKYDKPAICIGIYRYATLIRFWKRGLGFAYKSNMKFHIRIGWFNQVNFLDEKPMELPDIIFDNEL